MIVATHLPLTQKMMRIFFSVDRERIGNGAQQ